MSVEGIPGWKVSLIPVENFFFGQCLYIHISLFDKKVHNKSIIQNSIAIISLKTLYLVGFESGSSVPEADAMSTEIVKIELTPGDRVDSVLVRSLSGCVASRMAAHPWKCGKFFRPSLSLFIFNIGKPAAARHGRPDEFLKTSPQNVPTLFVNINR
jgi:hypothetical protein